MVRNNGIHNWCTANSRMYFITLSLKSWHLENRTRSSILPHCLRMDSGTHSGLKHEEVLQALVFVTTRLSMNSHSIEKDYHLSKKIVCHSGMNSILLCLQKGKNSRRSKEKFIVILHQLWSDGISIFMQGRFM